MSIEEQILNYLDGEWIEYDGGEAYYSFVVKVKIGLLAQFMNEIG